jgi:hypothetical protein
MKTDDIGVENMSPMNRTPFTDLMLHPEELEAALKSARRENDAFEASRKFGQLDGSGIPAYAFGSDSKQK